MPTSFAECINGLMGCNRIKPGSNGSAVFVETALEMHLKKGVLEHVFRESCIARVADEITVQLTFVAMHKHVEVGSPALVAISGEENLVRRLVEIIHHGESLRH